MVLRCGTDLLNEPLEWHPKGTLLAGKVEDVFHCRNQRKSRRSPELVGGRGLPESREATVEPPREYGIVEPRHPSNLP
jgi:hypothetical protein